MTVNTDNPHSEQLVIQRLSDEDFEQHVVLNPAPILVDFWADWCAPCKIIEPTLYELADEYQGRLRIAQVNIDHAPNITQQLNIRGFPCLLFFSEGRQQDSRLGALNKAQLKEFIDENL